MDVQTTPYQNRSLTFHDVWKNEEGKKSTHQNRIFMFCNGINNSQQDAIDRAKQMSELFDNAKVILAHNPTREITFFAWNVTQEIRNKEEELSASLAQRISDLLNDDKNIMILFAHSHGTFLTKRALELLKDKNKNKQVRVFGFGGVTMIPKELGFSVYNTIFNTDAFALIGNVLRKTTNESGFQALTTAMQHGDTPEHFITLFPGDPFPNNLKLGSEFKKLLANNWNTHNINLPLIIKESSSMFADSQVALNNHLLEKYFSLFKTGEANPLNIPLTDSNDDAVETTNHTLRNAGVVFLVCIVGSAILKVL